MNEYNSILADQGYTLIDRNRPYDQETQSISFAANLEPDLKAARRERVIIFIILLLVPAINLSSMTQSRFASACSRDRCASCIWKYPHRDGGADCDGKSRNHFVGRGYRIAH